MVEGNKTAFTSGGKSKIHWDRVEGIFWRSGNVYVLKEVFITELNAFDKI